ncbi:MAG TPA: hypothetical protein VIR27_11160 [Mycobacteriales bacterium]
MSTERCPITELLVDQCAHCRPTPPADPVADFLAREPFQATTIQARYPGRCPDCGERINEGDDITSSPNGWVCEGCA